MLAGIAALIIAVPVMVEQFAGVIEAGLDQSAALVRAGAALMARRNTSWLNRLRAKKTFDPTPKRRKRCRQKMVTCCSRYEGSGDSWPGRTGTGRRWVLWGLGPLLADSIAVDRRVRASCSIAARLIGFALRARLSLVRGAGDSSRR